MNTEFFEEKGQVVCGSQTTAEEFMRKLSIKGCDILDITEYPLKKSDIEKFGPSAVRLNVSEFPVHIVAEVVKTFSQ